MAEQSLPLGTRVRTRIATALVPRGAEGCVLGVWPTIPQAYDVRFDERRAPLLMWEDEIEGFEVEAAALVLGAP
jgi:hypothetical protein